MTVEEFTAYLKAHEGEWIYSGECSDAVIEEFLAHFDYQVLDDDWSDKFDQWLEYLES